MLTTRCSPSLSKLLKELGFPQKSIEFDSDYYTEAGKLLYSVDLTAEDKNLTFAPYIAEVIDRFAIDYYLYLSVFYTPAGYQYRIYDPAKKCEIVSDLSGLEFPQEAYELCICKTIEYYYDRQSE